MALRDTQRLENVIGSVQKYLATALAAYTLDLHPAAPIDTSGLNEWIEVHYLPAAAARFFRHGPAAAGDSVDDARLLVNVNIHTRLVDLLENDSGDTRRAWEIADAVDAVLHTGIKIPLYQLQDGGTPATQVGTAQVINHAAQHLGTGRTNASAGALDRELHVLNYTATLRWDREIAP